MSFLCFFYFFFFCFFLLKYTNVQNYTKHSHFLLLLFIFHFALWQALFEHAFHISACSRTKWYKQYEQLTDQVYLSPRLALHISKTYKQQHVNCLHVKIEHLKTGVISWVPFICVIIGVTEIARNQRFLQVDSYGSLQNVQLNRVICLVANRNIHKIHFLI